ncbi:hypothetical protein Tco_1459766 [Tanacetum coccineum]
MKYYPQRHVAGEIAGERIPDEASPAEIPQRHVAGERVRMSPGKTSNVVVENMALYPFEKREILLELLFHKIGLY